MGCNCYGRLAPSFHIKKEITFNLTRETGIWKQGPDPNPDKLNGSLSIDFNKDWIRPRSQVVQQNVYTQRMCASLSVFLLTQGDYELQKPICPLLHSSSLLPPGNLSSRNSAGLHCLGGIDPSVRDWGSLPQAPRPSLCQCRTNCNRFWRCPSRLIPQLSLGDCSIIEEILQTVTFAMSEAKATKISRSVPALPWKPLPCLSPVTAYAPNSFGLVDVSQSDPAGKWLQFFNLFVCLFAFATPYYKLLPNFLPSA